MPTLGTSRLGGSLRKTTFVVGTWEQSLSLLPINSPVGVYQVATKNRDQHWVLLSEGKMEEPVEPTAVPWSNRYQEPRDGDLFPHRDYVTSGHSLIPPSLKLESRTPARPPTWGTTDLQCVWTHSLKNIKLDIYESIHHDLKEKIQDP